MEKQELLDLVNYYENLLDFLDDNLPNLEDLISMFEEQNGEE